MTNDSVFRPISVNFLSALFLVAASRPAGETSSFFFFIPKSIPKIQTICNISFIKIIYFFYTVDTAVRGGKPYIFPFVIVTPCRMGKGVLVVGKAVFRAGNGGRFRTKLVLIAAVERPVAALLPTRCIPGKSVHRGRGRFPQEKSAGGESRTTFSSVCHMREKKKDKKNGGESGIRTHVELPLTTFPMWRLRPLDHLSGMIF